VGSVSASKWRSQPLHSAALERVRVTAATKTFGATPALRGVSCEFVRGSITVLGGPNGAGKSTLLALVGTQLRPTRGSVVHSTVDGKELDRQGIRALLGWVSHDTHCYQQLSGRQNVELFARMQGVPPERYGLVAERLGLGKFAERPVGSLSRGQKQRIALARALIHEPELLLLDEPWTGLDESSSALLMQAVREEAEAGATVVVVSHEPALAERLGARELRLVQGRLAP
jgi:ABC-type multidrug transport system ATPase subunit